MFPPAGWHPDPYDPLVERYWDGQQWTAHTRPKGAADPTRAFAPVAGAAPQNADEPTKRRRKWPWIAGAAVVGLLAIGAFGNDAPKREDATSVVVTSSAASTTTPTTTTRRATPTSTTVAVVPLVPQRVEETTTSAYAPPPTTESYSAPATTEPAYVPPPTSEVPAYTPPPETYEAPAYTPPPPVEAPSSVHYKNCTAARAAGAAPIYVGEPGYRLELDRNKDGVACEN